MSETKLFKYKIIEESYDEFGVRLSRNEVLNLMSPKKINEWGDTQDLKNKISELEENIECLNFEIMGYKAQEE